MQNLQNKAQLQYQELNFADLLHDSTQNSPWLKDKNFALYGWAANYSFIYILFRILDNVQPAHILEMGLTPKTEVLMVKAAPLGDPLEIKVRGYELTLRKKDAAEIEIMDVHKAESCPVDLPNLKAPLSPRKGEAQDLKMRR